MKDLNLTAAVQENIPFRHTALFINILSFIVSKIPILYDGYEV